MSDRRASTSRLGHCDAMVTHTAASRATAPRPPFDATPRSAKQPSDLNGLLPTRLDSGVAADGQDRLSGRPRHACGSRVPPTVVEVPTCRSAPPRAQGRDRPAGRAPLRAAPVRRRRAHCDAALPRLARPALHRSTPLDRLCRGGFVPEAGNLCPCAIKLAPAFAEVSSVTDAAAACGGADLLDRQPALVPERHKLPCEPPWRWLREDLAGGTGHAAEPDPPSVDRDPECRLQRRDRSGRHDPGRSCRPPRRRASHGDRSTTARNYRGTHEKLAALAEQTTEPDNHESRSEGTHSC